MVFTSFCTDSISTTSSKRKQKYIGRKRFIILNVLDVYFIY